MILSIDIGIKNLSLCAMDCLDKTELSTYKIHLWKVYNTLENDNFTCKSLQKSGKICGKKCSYKYGGEFYCKTHFPKTIVIKKENIHKSKLIKNYLLQDIAKAVLLCIQEIYKQNEQLFKNLNGIILELQPSMNKSMIFVSHLIYAKLIELQLNNFLQNNCSIKFVRASQKLKAYTGPEIMCKLKGKYAQRKWLSIEYTKYFLENKFNQEEMEKWLPDFLSCGKADDRGDCLLMSLNNLHGIPKKQKMNFKKTNL